MSTHHTHNHRSTVRFRLTTEALEQRSMLSVNPLDTGIGIAFEDTTSSDNDVNDVRIAANAPQLASMTLQNDGVLHANPNDSPGPYAPPLSGLVLHANPNDSPGPFSPDFATATISTGPEEHFGVLPADALTPDIPQILDDLPSKEVIESVIRAGLENAYATTPEYIDPSISDAMIQTIYMEMVLGSMVYGTDGVTGAEVAAEVATDAASETASGWIGGWLGQLFGTTTTVVNASETAAEGATETCRYFSTLRDRLSRQTGEDDGHGVKTCKELASGDEESDNEDEECFPPIILEELTAVVEPFVQASPALDQDLDSFLDHSMQNQVTQMHHAQSASAVTLGISARAAAEQAFSQWL